MDKCEKKFVFAKLWWQNYVGKFVCIVIYYFQAYGAKGEVDLALRYLRRAIKLDPESKLMQQEMLNLTRRKYKETATEKELYQRMLGVKPGDASFSAKDKKGSASRVSDGFFRCLYIFCVCVCLFKTYLWMLSLYLPIYFLCVCLLLSL